MSILRGIKLPLQGGGHSRRSFIHMDDVSRATHTLANKGYCGDCYHISTDRIISIRELVAMICKMLGKEFESCVDIVDDRIGKDAAYLLDAGKLKTTLQWRASVELQPGLEATVAWARDHYDTLRKLPMEYLHKA